MIAPVISIEGLNGAVSIFNSTFTRIDTMPIAGEPDITLVADPLPTNKLFGDSLAANDILDGVKEFETAPPELFLVDRDPGLTTIQRVRPSPPGPSLSARVPSLSLSLLDGCASSDMAVAFLHTGRGTASAQHMTRVGACSPAATRSRSS